MGLGDYIQYTAIIRDLYNFINEPKNIDEKIKNINTIKKSTSLNTIGIIEYKHKNNNNIPFKFYIKCSKKYKIEDSVYKKHPQCRIIFSNNPYVTTDIKYENIIYIRIISNYYWLENNKKGNYKVNDEVHIVNRYANILGLNEFNIFGELYPSKIEIENVKKFLPSKKFILISFEGKIKSRCFSLIKTNKLVIKLKELYPDFDIIQIIPKHFHKLDNVITYDNFTFNETIFFAKHAEFCIVSHGGLSIGLSCFKTPTICLYSGLFNPTMTTCDSEILLIFVDKRHHFCYNINCNKCIDGSESYKLEYIMEKIEYLQKNKIKYTK